MKYYKAFKRDKTCRGFKFEEGETYKVEGPPVLCSNGFHFCKDLVLTLEYYTVSNSITENVYAEIEAIGEVVFDEPTKHKGCTDIIKITRFLSDDEVLGLFDENSNSGNSNSGNGNSGDWNSGDWNSGNRNSGDSNSGNGNSGNRNSGNRNSGDSNSGNSNSGYSNSGNGNSGDCNSGDWNSGNSNSGDWNSGNRNSGEWNSCDRESGFFNSETPTNIRVFNSPCDLEIWNSAEKPDFLYFEIDPEIGYKSSFKKAYESASDEEKVMLTKLPNFDADVFFEISGIRVEGESA